MRKTFLAFLIITGLGFAGSAQAQHSRGFSIGARLAYSIPMGTAFQNGGIAVDQSSLISGAFPIWFEGGYRFNPNVYVGGYLQLSPASVSSTECGGGSCSGSNTRLGVNGIYHFTPHRSFDPWVGLGFGYEWTSWSVDDVDYGLRGFQFFEIEVGGDFRLAPHFTLGPFMDLTFGQYGTYTEQTAGTTTIQDIAGGDSGTHSWLQIGVKGTFDL